ncbi:hypothetical protein GLP21_08990 [Photobacterium carnosum]|uniref:AAA-like domain-containing protein n=1 Tax=Photobacterium carnosum TaxID=2023717 RepID=UPI001E553251|nr:AAA-like domain-containing protein [Photobacterium carnosum]MCD9548768.1 hypothetical protein [Photobacterium carnosum]MCF2304897.1 hypothetical protein [Photobacterium carnosum]
MRNKVLKSYTTIPSHLYVSREADNQLRDIIEDMQRPGYVLVARQMGKTNLLFNAIRELESDSRKFVYIDLSNKFDTERECYNFIIDSILDLYDEELWELRTDIEALRKKTKTDHISYTKSLLKILKNLKTDLVIILDEIDALRSSEYSDNIFSVIRSNYFTRSNYPEFENLTYILSGVIEPKDLIKDRNKSPFNIGEKIYLDDFTYNEFLTFIEKSCLSISEEVKLIIYDWTSGNPRLTFDICSEVESIYLKNSIVTCDDVNNIVKNKYLTSYDIAPIDHIRELISDDKEIQEILLNLKSDSNHISPISDNIINKLYLYGIIPPRNKDNNLKIKNKIIDLSLPLSWLKSLNNNARDILDKAMALIDNAHDYYEGIKLLKGLIDNNDLDPLNNSLILHYLGFAEHQIGMFEESNIHFLAQPISKNTVPTLHYRQKLFTGLNYYQLNNIQLGNDNLKYVIENYKNTITWANAALNFSLQNINEPFAYALLQEIISMPENIDHEMEHKKHVNETIIKLKSFAYYYLSTFNKKLKKEEILDYIDKAISLQVYEHQPSLLIHKAVTIDAFNAECVKQVVSFVIDNQIEVVNKNDSSPLAYSNNLNYTLLSYCFDETKATFEKLKNYSITNLKISEDTLYLNTSLKNIDVNKKYDILYEYISKNEKNCSKKIISRYIYDSLQINKLDHTVFNTYINKVVESQEITKFDIITIASTIKYCSEHNNSHEGVSYTELILFLLDEVTEELRYDSSVIYYWAFECAIMLNNKSLYSSYGNKALERLQTATTKKTIINNKGFNSIKNRISEILYPINQRNEHLIPVVSTKIYGRNEKIQVKYSDGTIIYNKYKKLKDDLDNNICSVIN